MVTTAAILTTGTELVRGELVDQNSAWLSSRLIELGFVVTEHRTIGDDDEDFHRAFLELTARHTLLFVTGGLGPTTDDRTSACVAHALGVPLVRDPEALRQLESFILSRGFQVGESNRKQADFPAGATILPNPVGTAPGFTVPFQRASAYFFPGVPREMQAIFETSVAPRLKVGARTLVMRKLRTFGVPESHINDALAGLEVKHGVVLGYRASDAEIEVKVFASAIDDEDVRRAEERARAAVVDIKVILGRAIYAEGETSLAEEVLFALRARGLRLALAESCTGGLVSTSLTDIAGASDVFLGGVVSYGNSVKTHVLGVAEKLLSEHGAVSPEVAKAMALGAREKLGADVAIGITGIAGPGGGSDGKPVGLVHFAFALGDRLVHLERRFNGERALVRRRATKYALFQLLSLLTNPSLSE
jgi:nicotinamide-nucleotide amidase